MNWTLARTLAMIIFGITCWVVAGIVGLLLNADSKFIWTCVFGTLLGLIGIRYTIRRARRSGI